MQTSIPEAMPAGAGDRLQVEPTRTQSRKTPECLLITKSFPSTEVPLPGCEAIWQCPGHGGFHFQMEATD